jgi:lipopolysaccharide exporter
MDCPTDQAPERLLTRAYRTIKQPLDSLLLGEGLKAKVLRGGTWLGAGSFAEQFIRFARNMILARLLAPEAFGAMAVVLSASSVIHTITDIGVKEAIIQNPRGTEPRYTSAAWWLSLSRAMSLYALFFILAPWISRFYGNPELCLLLRVVGVGVIFDGALSSQAYVAMKEMKFGRWAVITNGGGILGVVITVILSLFLRDVWALALGAVAEAASRCVLSYIACPYLPSLSWDRDAIRDLLHFSRGLFGLSFLNLIFMRTDVFVLAKMRTSTELGLYVMAIALVQTPMGFAMNLLGQTLLPTFSQVQGNEPRTNRILLQVTKLLVFLGLPTLVFVFFCGRSILTLAYGHSYGVAAWPLMIASCVALANLLNGQITTIFYAKGSPQLHRWCVVIMAIMMIGIIYPFVGWFGLVGGQLACLASIAAGYAFQIARVRRLTGLDLRQYGKPLFVAAPIAVAVAGFCVVARFLAAGSNPLSNLVSGVVAWALAYGLSIVLFARRRSDLAV